MKLKVTKIMNKAVQIIFAIAVFMTVFDEEVYASGTDFKTTKLYTGTIALANNLTLAIVGAAEVVGVLVLVALYFKQLGAEDDEIPRIKKMRKTAIYIMVIIGLVGSLLAVVLSYYK